MVPVDLDEAVRQREREVEEAVEEFKKTIQVPKAPSYDFDPFLKALCENYLLRPPAEIGDDERGYKNSGHRFDNTKTIHLDKLVPKAPGSGSWDYVWYIPEWSHPEYDPTISMTSSGNRSWRVTDQVGRAHPALRVEDQVRQPTEWAKRFGIHPDEPGGRSRLSPTSSQSRGDPIRDYTDHINFLRGSLSEQQLAEAVVASKDAAQKANVNDPNYIDPGILDQLVQQTGGLSVASVRRLIKSTSDSQMMISLEKMVALLNRNSKQTLHAYRGFFRNALNDQNLQRVVFSDMTSDELVLKNIFTMSDDVQYNLSGDLHPLLERRRWEDSSWKGTDKFSPRLVYNLNGVREEYNMVENDKLWDALQPALQLVTRVLQRNPPTLAALMDMNTRVKLPAERDRRQQGETPYIPIYSERGLHGGNMETTWDEILELANYGYDWPGNTMRILLGRLRLDFCHGFTDPGVEPDDAEAVYGKSEFSYGFTRLVECGTDSFISLWVAAELVWPLLVPQFSQSEKMAVSFMIATTILHELAHAVNCSHRILTKMRWAHPPDQPAIVTDTVLALGDQLWDRKNLSKEPVHEGQPAAESGFDFEYSLWGTLAFSLLDASQTLSRQLRTLPMVVAGSRWPLQKYPSNPQVADTMHAVESYVTPVTLDYMARFFTEKFWTDDFNQFGQEALKMPASDEIMKTVNTSAMYDPLYCRQVFGRDEWGWLNFVCGTLLNNNHVIIGKYLEQLLRQVIMARLYTYRWMTEIRTWSNDILRPLQASLNKLFGQLGDANQVHNQLYADHATKRAYYDGYCDRHYNQVAAGMANGPPMTSQQWEDHLNQRWVKMFGWGGVLMLAASETHRYLLGDIPLMQRMIFDFFTLQHSERHNIYNGLGATDQGPIGAAYGRMEGCRIQLDTIIKTFTQISNIMQLYAVRGPWNQWIARFRACYDRYDDMLRMLGSPDEYEPNDLRWKEKFASIPSSYHRSRLDRLRALAHREYNRLDPRIRIVVDDFERMIRAVPESDRLPHILNSGDSEELADTLEQIREVGLAQDAVDLGSNLFVWQNPGTNTGTLDELWNDIANNNNQNAPPRPQPAPDGSAGVVFGQSNQLNIPHALGAKPPRRKNGPGPGLPSGASPSGSSGDEESPSRGALGPSTQGGIRRRRAEKGFRDRAKVVNFLQAATKLGALEEFTNIGISTNTIKSVLGTGPQPLGMGGPFPPALPGESQFLPPPAAAAAHQSFTPASIGPPVTGPFPHPYADWRTLSSDVKAHVGKQANPVAGAVAAGKGAVGAMPYKAQDEYRDVLDRDDTPSPPPGPQAQEINQNPVSVPIPQMGLWYSAQTNTPSAPAPGTQGSPTSHDLAFHHSSPNPNNREFNFNTIADPNLPEAANPQHATSAPQSLGENQNIWGDANGGS
ncbi:hypothetical protein AAE478_001332 [Parahypoxylon ruwenzoriense]